MHTKMLMGAGFALATLALSTMPACAGSIWHKEASAEAAIPVCDRSLGTVAIREPDHNWWTDLNLASPEVLLKVFVRQSGCFTLVDRGKGFEMAQEERALAERGSLQRGSHIGRGQVRAADYILVPDIASKNKDANHVDIGAVFGLLLHSAPVVGAILSSVSLDSKTADVVLSIVDVRTSEDGPIEQGHAEKTDIGFGGGGLGIGASGFGGAAISSYEHSDIGQVVTLAYIQAYTKLVTDMGGHPVVPVPVATLDAQASAAASDSSKGVAGAAPAASNGTATAPAAGTPAHPIGQAYAMAKIGHLFKSDTPSSPKLRTLMAGAFVYPTGVQSGDWLQVKDEMGTLGWVRVDFLAMAK